MKNIKRKISILLVFLLLFDLNISFAAENNDDLVSSAVSECENNAALTGLRSPLDNSAVVTRAVDNTYKHSGTGSVRVSAASSSYLPLIAFVPSQTLTAGDTYCFSVWYNDLNGAAGSCNFEFVARTSSGIPVASRKLSAAGGWQKYECIFAAGADYVNDLNYFYIRANGFVGDICFDDVSLKKLGADEVYNAMIESEVAACESQYALDTFKTYRVGSFTRSCDYTVYHGGAGSVKVSVTSDNLSCIGFKPYAALEKDGRYYFSVWYKDARGTTDGNLVLRGRNTSDSAILMADTAKQIRSGDWNKFECTFVPTDEMINNLKFFYLTITGISTYGDMYFDDITFRRINTDTEYDNIISADVAECESDNALNAFNTYKIGTQTKVIDNTELHSGTGSVRVSVTSDNLSYIGFKPVEDLVEGETYYFSVWYKDERQTASGNLVLRGRNRADTAVLMPETARPISVGGWYKYECTFRAEYTHASELNYLYLTSDSTDARSMYFDDICLKKADPRSMMTDSAVSACESSYALNAFMANKSSADTATKEIDYTTAHSGAGSLKVVLDGGYKTYVGIAPVSTPVSGKRYYFSIWYYNPESITGTMYLRYAYPNKDSIGNWITGTGTADTDCGRTLAPGWNKYEYSFTADSKIASSDLKYFYITVSAASGTLYFDDIVLREIPEEETYLLYTDTASGELVDCDRTFEYVFNNGIDEKSFPEAAVSLNGGMRHDALLSLSDDSKTLSVKFSNQLQRGRKYTLKIDNITDLWGRSVSCGNLDFTTVGDFDIIYNVYDVADGKRTEFAGKLGGRIDVVADAVNNTTESKNYVLFLAEYNDGKLVGLSGTEQKTAASGQTQQNVLSLDTTQGDAIKLIVLDSVDNMRPIMPAKAISSGDAVKNVNAAKYLIDDIWTAAISYDSVVRPSSWDVDRSGGSVTGKSGAYVVMNDTSTTDAVTMEREFSQKAENNLTFETSLSLSSTGNNFTIQAGGEGCALKLMTQGSYLCYENESGLSKILTAYSANQSIGIKAVFDIENRSVSIYVNGAYRAAVPFKEHTAYIDRIRFATTEGSTVNATVGYVKAYENYIINESFSATAEGALPAEFTAEGSASVFRPSNTSSNSDKHLKLSGSASGVRTEFTHEGKKLYAGFKFLLSDASAALTADIGDGFTLSAGGGSLNCCGETLYSYRNNIWYQADIEINEYSSTAQLKLNGKVLADDIVIDGNGGFSDLVFTAAGEVWLDDIVLYEKQNEYTVPAINAPDGDDYLVGMQTYFMWREGTHYGWDRISPYPERKPYLGWYTDGSPEVSDWEIKWMSEHGIDYEIFPWARNDLNKNAAVKRPVRSDALHDGFFNAKNSDKMKFALMWSMISSSTLGGSEDFREHIVPYWLEYYFSDPRYLLIDNKPFISVYGYDNLVSVLGSDAAVKAEFDYLRSECVNAGFDGVYIAIITDETDSAEVFSRISGFGADAVYAYHWLYGSNTSKYQIESIKKQIANNTQTTSIPYISMGWNTQPWLGMPGGFCPLDEYEQVLRYSKEQVDALKQSGKINNKLVIVGNWNEYGEGHFVMPSGVEGFGYLDKIRAVFTTAGDGSHNDAVPTQDQINSMGYLYKQDRVGEKVVPDPPEASAYTNVIKSWDFNESAISWWISGRNQWSYGSITDFNVNNGILSGNSTGKDPIFFTKNDIDLDITDADYVKIRMRLTDSASGTASIMFTTADNPEWGSGKYVSFCPNQDGFYDYYVYMGSNSRWRGTLKKLRVDPMESTGKFEIDYIQIMKKGNA